MSNRCAVICPNHGRRPQHAVDKMAYTRSSRWSVGEVRVEPSRMHDARPGIDAAEE